jgi:hypothetical protein
MRLVRIRTLVLVLALPLVLPGLFAVEKPYQTGRLVDVQQKTRSVVLYYLVNTPVTRDERYYEVSVQLRNTVYVAQYTPPRASEALPEGWKPDAEVQARIEGHHLFLRLPESAELQFVILRHKDAAPEPAAKH